MNLSKTQFLISQMGIIILLISIIMNNNIINLRIIGRNNVLQVPSTVSEIW